MLRFVYKEIQTDVLTHRKFFQQKLDADGQLCGKTDLKIFAALKILVDDRMA